MLKYIKCWIEDNWVNAICLLVIGIVYISINEYYVTLIVGGVIILGTACLPGKHKKRDIYRYILILTLWAIYKIILY